MLIRDREGFEIAVRGKDHCGGLGACLPWVKVTYWSRALRSFLHNWRGWIEDDACRG